MIQVSAELTDRQHDASWRTTGHLLSAAALPIARAKADGVDLIITVDNGISAHDAARRAAELGIDLIITDHHSIENGLPDGHLPVI